MLTLTDFSSEKMYNFIKSRSEKMYRLAIKKLKEWKNKEDRKPMILMAARQVGKTWIMKEFGKNEYAKVAYISFYSAI